MTRSKSRLVEPDVYGPDSIQVRASRRSTGDTRTTRKYQLFLDGTLVKNVEVETWGQSTPGGIWFSFRTSDEEAFGRLGKYNLRQLPDKMNEVTFVPSGLEWARSLKEISFLASYEEEDLKEENLVGEVSVDFVPSFANWKSFYTPSEYFEELSRAVECEEKIGTEWVDGLDIGLPDKFIVWFDVSIDESIVELLRRSIIQLERIHYSVERRLSERLGKAILKPFEFPDDIRVACEQYLFYFAQFLRDLGLEDSSALRQDASTILFSVTPTDQHQALHKIRTALESYSCEKN